MSRIRRESRLKLIRRQCTRTHLQHVREELIRRHEASPRFRYLLEENQALRELEAELAKKVDEALRELIANICYKDALEKQIVEEARKIPWIARFLDKN